MNYKSPSTSSMLDPVSNLTVRRVVQEFENFYAHLLEYFTHHCGAAVQAMARFEFFDRDHSLYNTIDINTFNGILIPWMLFTWVPSTRLPGKNTLPIAHHYLDENPTRLNSLQKKFIHACLKTSYSYFELIQIAPHATIWLKDILRGTTMAIRDEKFNTCDVRVGLIFYGQIIQLNGVYLFVSLAPTCFDADFKILFQQVRKTLLRPHQRLSTKIIWHHQSVLHALYINLLKGFKTSVR